MARRTALHTVRVYEDDDEVFTAILSPYKDGGTKIDSTQSHNAIEIAVCLTAVLSVATLAPPQIAVKLLAACGELVAWIQEYYPDIEYRP